MEKRWLEGGQDRGNRNEGEPLRQPSRGDGSRTAQSVSLNTLPKTGWLTHKHTLLTLNTKRQCSDTHAFCLSAHTILWNMLYQNISTQTCTKRVPGLYLSVLAACGQFSAPCFFFCFFFNQVEYIAPWWQTYINHDIILGSRKSEYIKVDTISSDSNIIQIQCYHKCHQCSGEIIPEHQRHLRYFTSLSWSSKIRYGNCSRV